MTGTALEVMDPQDAPPEKRRDPGIDFDALMRFAAEVVPTGLLPSHIKTAGQCVAIILTGRELGMAPMRAIRSLKLVQGKVIEDADSQLARFKADGGRAIFRTLTDERAVLWLRHPNGDEHTETFTIADAERAKLAGKDIWRAYPKAMLRSRAITAGLKSIGWEGGVGAYGVEEAASFAGTPEPAVSGGPATATDAQRARLLALSQRVDVFSPQQCDGLADSAEDADLAAETAADLIRRAESKCAKYEAAHVDSASAEGNGAAPATETTEDDDEPPASEESRLHVLRNRVAARLLHQACATLRAELTQHLDTMTEHQLRTQLDLLEDIIAADRAAEQKRAQGHKGMAARRAKEASAPAGGIAQPDAAQGEFGTL